MAESNPFIESEHSDDDSGSDSDPTDLGDVDDIIQNGGRKKNTIQKEAMYTRKWTEFLEANETTHDEVMKDKASVEESLCKFFHGYKVFKKSGRKLLPMRNTADCIRSHLKQYFQRSTDGKIDISNEIQFPKFTMFFKGYRKGLKSKGRGDTKNNKALPKGHTVEINKLLVLLHQAMIGKPFLIDHTKSLPVKTTNPEYAQVLEKIPKVRLEGKQRITAHNYLAQYGAQYIIQKHFASRGIERMNQYEKKDFKIFTDEDDNSKYWKCIKGGETKCHKEDSEDVERKGGRIYFTPNDAGLNPGQYLEDFMAKLNPKCKKLMQRPRVPSKNFRLEENPDIWFEPNVVGIHTIAKMLPTLTSVLALTRYTNNAIRPSAIQAMKNANFSDREIVTVSGHRDPNSLKHYNPTLSNSTAKRMAMSIMNVGEPSKTQPEQTHAALTTSLENPSSLLAKSHNNLSDKGIYKRPPNPRRASATIQSYKIPDDESTCDAMIDLESLKEIENDPEYSLSQTSESSEEYRENGPPQKRKKTTLENQMMTKKPHNTDEVPMAMPQIRPLAKTHPIVELEIEDEFCKSQSPEPPQTPKFVFKKPKPSFAKIVAPKDDSNVSKSTTVAKDTSNFFRFSRVKSLEIRKVNPNIGTGTLMAEVRRMWQGLSNDEKSAYGDSTDDDNNGNKLVQYKIDTVDGEKSNISENENCLVKIPSPVTPVRNQVALPLKNITNTPRKEIEIFQKPTPGSLTSLPKSEKATLLFRQQDLAAFNARTDAIKAENNAKQLENDAKRLDNDNMLMQLLLEFSKTE